MAGKKNNGGTGLGQILLNVVILGAFSIVENWLLFYYESQVLPIIFGVLIIMMYCLLTINIYNCFMGSLRRGGASGDERQVQAVLYKQLKKVRTELPESTQGALDALEARVGRQLEEMKLNQLRSTKALMNKMEEAQQAGTLTAAESLSSEDLQRIEDKMTELQKAQEELKVLIESLSVSVPAVEQVAFVDEAAAEEQVAEDENFEADDLPGVEEESFEADGMSLMEEESFEAEEVPPMEEESFEAEDMPLMAEEGFEAEEVPLMEEESFEADGMPLMEEESFEAEEELLMEEEGFESDGMPLMEEEGFEAEEVPLMEEEGFEAEDIPLMEEEALEADDVVEGDSEAAKTEEPVAVSAGNDMDPNRQLTPDEIAALFAGVN